jgi:PhnB protein
MARVCTYLNFPRTTEAAFNFYKTVFGTEFGGMGIMRLGDAPPQDGAPALAPEDKQLIMHVELPILAGHVLMGTDATDSMGFSLNMGNNAHIMLEPDSRAETQKLFDALAAGGKVTMPLTDMFWGALYGSCTDRFGMHWMFNCNAKG